MTFRLLANVWVMYYFVVVMELRSQDIRQILSLSERALACETMPDLQREMLLGIKKLIGCESGIFFDVAGTVFGWQFAGGQSFGVSQSALREWRKNRQIIDPFVVRLMGVFQSHKANILTSCEIMSNYDYENNSFYNDFLKPQSIHHVLAVGLGKSKTPGGVPRGLIGIHRPKKNTPFSLRDLAKMRALIPHLTAAVQNIKFAELNFERDVVVEILSGEKTTSGIIILNQDRVPIFADKNFFKLFAMPCDADLAGTQILTTFLPLQIIRSCKKLNEMICTSGQKFASMEVKFTLLQKQKVVECTIHAQLDYSNVLRYFVCVHDWRSNTCVGNVSEQYGLTPREIEVAELIIQGMTNPRIAEMLGISARTVQNHLRAIYPKVSVNNRTSLATHLLAVNLPNRNNSSFLN